MTENLSSAWRSIENCVWLTRRSLSFCARLRDIAELRTFKRNEAVYLAGDPPNGMFGVVEGSVHLYLPRHDGVDFVAYRSGKGYWIGDLALFAHHARLVSVWAAEKTLTIHLPANALRELVNEEPEFYADFYDLTYINMQLALQVLSSFSEESVDRRTARRLLAEAERRGDHPGRFPITQSELAEMLAVSLPTMRRCLNRLASHGSITLGYSQIQVVDRRTLLHLCGGNDFESFSSIK